MSKILFLFPGQKLTLFVETKDGYGERKVTGSVEAAPVVNKVILPSLNEDVNYPQSMTNMETGLYKHEYTLPGGESSIGTYFFDISYVAPDTGITIPNPVSPLLPDIDVPPKINTETYEVIVQRPICR